MENRRISEYDPMPTGIEDTDLFETARPSIANYKASWSFLRSELSNFFSALFHSSRHEVGGADVINVTGLSGDLADPQTPKKHSSTHGVTGPDSINVTGLSGELADPQPPKTHDNTAHSETYITDTVEHGNEKHNPDFSQIGLATGQINSLTEKTTPVADDILIIEDSAAGMAGKKMKMSNLPPSEDIEMVVTNMTYGETIAVNDAVYMADDGKVYKMDNSNILNLAKYIGFAKESGVADEIKKIQISGVVSGFTSLTKGIHYFISSTAGQITKNLGMSNEYPVALSISDSKVKIIKYPFTTTTSYSDVLRHSNDTQRSTSSTSYVKLKEIKVNQTITKARIKFDFNLAGSVSGPTGSEARIYKNDSPIGTIRETSSTIYKTFSEDLAINSSAGDLIQLYAKKTTDSDIYSVLVKNFRIYYSQVKDQDIDGYESNYINQDPV